MTVPEVETADVEVAPKKKRKKPVSATSKTLAELRKRGWQAGVVERRIPKSPVTIDLFNCIDIVAITPAGLLAIQATSGANHASRVAKVLAEPRAKLWVEAGGRFEVWSWSKRGDRGARKLWTLRVEDVAPALRDLAEADV